MLSCHPKYPTHRFPVSWDDSQVAGEALGGGQVDLRCRPKGAVCCMHTCTIPSGANSGAAGRNCSQWKEEAREGESEMDREETMKKSKGQRQVIDGRRQPLSALRRIADMQLGTIAYPLGQSINPRPLDSFRSI